MRQTVVTKFMQKKKTNKSFSDNYLKIMEDLIRIVIMDIVPIILIMLVEMGC